MGVVSALRPFRRDGLRLDYELLPNDKIVYHNYGHGAWGLNLSYSTALIQIEKFERDFKNFQKDKHEILVLGSGMVGLITAWILLEKGYRVKMATKHLIREVKFKPNDP